MTIRILALLALLGFMGSANAFRVIEQRERPFELTLTQLTLPKDTAGNVTLHECDNCGISTRRFFDGAKFVIDGKEVQYAAFLKIVTDLKGNTTASEKIVANVYVDIATERVTRVAFRNPRH